MRHNIVKSLLHLIKILSALDIVKDVPLFDRTKQDITDTIQRLDNQITKVGVFGTFSAGKSSLINALLGDNYIIW